MTQRELPVFSIKRKGLSLREAADAIAKRMPAGWYEEEGTSLGLVPGVGISAPPPPPLSYDFCGDDVAPDLTDEELRTWRKQHG